MKKVFYFASLLLSLNARADGNTPPTTDVSILKLKVAPFRAAIDKGVGTASSLKPQFRSPRTEIDYDRCKEIEAKISTQYPLSPFRAIYQNGSSFASLCDWNPERPSKDESVTAKMRYYFEPIQAKTSFGLQASFILRVETPDLSGPFIRGGDGTGEYLLDAQYRFLEISGRTAYPNNIDSDVISMNAQGDYFYHSLPGTGGQGNITERAFYYAADGILSGWRVKVPRRSDHGKEIIINRNYRVNQKDWQTFLLIPNHMLGGFYQRNDGKWYSSNLQFDSLDEILLADTDREVCADGETSTGSNGWISYKPSNDQDPWWCGNVW